MIYNLISNSWLYLLIPAIIISNYGCASIEQNSEWMQDKIMVDGKAEDWESNLTYYEDDGIMIGFHNDISDMYICMKTTAAIPNKAAIKRSLLFCLS